MSKRRIVRISKETSSINVPFPGIEEVVSSNVESKDSSSSILGELAVKAARRIDTKISQLFKTVRDPNATDQEIDQGHGWIRVPVEEPIKKPKLSTRPIENRYSDIGSDLRADIPQFDPNEDISSSEVTSAAPGLGRIAARDMIDSIEATNILNEAGGDSVLAAAIQRSRQEKPRD